MPPTYRQVAPKQSKISFHMGPPPPSHQPATQLDQTVGTFEARPRTSSVCHWPRPFVLESDMREQEIRPSGKCKNKGVTQQALQNFYACAEKFCAGRFRVLPQRFNLLLRCDSALGEFIERPAILADQ